MVVANGFLHVFEVNSDQCTVCYIHLQYKHTVSVNNKILLKIEFKNWSWKVLNFIFHEFFTYIYINSLKNVIIC